METVQSTKIAGDELDLVVSFPGGKRVDVRIGDFLVHTDQPLHAGGEGKAPAAFDLFLGAIAACAGTYALGFCQSRGIATDGLALRQRNEVDESTKLVKNISLIVTLPVGFPDKYRTALMRAIEACKVKKNIFAPPSISVQIQEDSSQVTSDDTYR